MEPSHRFLPERKNRGNRMSELAKDEGKMLEDDKDGIFKEDSSDDDFNPDDVKKDYVDSSSNFENGEEDDEEGEEGEDEEGEEEEDDEGEPEEEEKIKKKEKKEKKKEEEILDIEQLDIDKIDMIEDLRDKGDDVDDEEELEKRMREYNEESEFEEDEDISKKKKAFKKKDIKKKGKKKKTEKVDDNIFLNNQTQEENSNQNKEEESNKSNTNIDNNAEFRNGKIIISNPEFEENNMDLEEDSEYNNNKSIKSNKSMKSNKSKKNKKGKNKIKININPETDSVELFNPNVTIDKNLNITINKICFTENLFPKSHPNLEYIEINKNIDMNMNIGKTRKSKMNYNLNEKNNNKNIFKDFTPKQENKKKNNNKIIEDDDISSNTNIINDTNKNSEIKNELLGHKRTRYVNNLIELFKKQKKAKINKNVTIIGNRDNPKLIYVSKKIYDENDAEKESQKEDKKKKKKETIKQKDEEDENISFNLEEEIDTKNIIKKYKQQERDKKQFGIQNKVISQEQRLLESIFTELTNKQSLKTMQKLEDLNKREYTTTSRKILKDSIRIINSQRHILEAEKEKEKEKLNSNKKQVIEVKITNVQKNEPIKEEKKEIKEINKEIKENKENGEKEENKEMIVEENIKEEKIENKEEIKTEEEKIKEKELKEQKEKELKEKKEKELKEQEEKKKEEENKKLMEEYKEREKKLNKITVTFTNKEYFRSIFASMNKKPVKDKKEKICIITGKPAKYFDPLTKNYYSTIEAFKILRERYFQKEEDCLLFKIQTLSDLASQKKERLKKMIMQENENTKAQNDLNINNNINKSNSIRIDSETMTVEDQDDTGSKMGVNSTLLKMISKFGLLRKDGGGEEKKVISHRIYNRNRENCVESGMLLEANKYKLIISKKIFKDKYSSKLPSTNEINSTNINSVSNNNNNSEKQE